MFYQEAALRIIACHRQELPDLRGLIVILPNYHAAQPLARSLITEAKIPALLLPAMMTLEDWVARVELGKPVDTDTQRIALLYQVLRDNKWFEQADLWSLARELLELIDQFTRNHVPLPDSSDAFAAQLAAAYTSRNGASLQFEARIVHELWFAMAHNSEADSVRAYQHRLAHIADQVTQPVYVLLTSDPSKSEIEFFDRCRQRVAVTLFDIRQMASQYPGCALFTGALGSGQDLGNLRNVVTLYGNTTAARLSDRLQFFPANGLEHEARAADVQIRRWLLDGKQSIAVVVQDRLTARRVRALLERGKVQVQDESGWTFATLSVSTVLMGWLETLQNDFYYQDVLDLLKSPFLFADLPPDERRHIAYLFEQMVRKQGAISSLENLIDNCSDSALQRALVRLRQAATHLNWGSISLSNWLQALNVSLDTLGVLAAWAGDPAGQQLLQLLKQWREELTGHTSRCNFGELKRWLAQQLDLNTFRDMSIESPVVFTHLAATRWRRFDAVLLLGCDAQHLPSPGQDRWFNDSVRSSLGLPLSSVQRDRVRDDLFGVLALNQNILVTWQAHRNGEPNLLSPHFEILRTLHILAYGNDLSADELGEILSWATIRKNDFVLPTSGEMPHPAVAPDMLPVSITPSAYNSLVACPYQFMARHILRLNDLDEVREAVDKRDYGTWVHTLLQRFHEAYPRLSSTDKTLLNDELERISEEVFADAMQHDYSASAWLARWRNRMPDYLDWQLQREQAGWHYQKAESSFDIAIIAGLNLRGRVDRIDSDADGNLSVLDYKTQSSTVLKNKLHDAGEDVQLACYAQGVNACEAAFVSLENNPVQTIAPPHSIRELAQANLLRLQTVFGQMHHGAKLPANAAETACRYCEMRGLCRQGAWEDIHG